MSAPVRVRFAPSPTGFFHIGSARTALFNWLYARHCGGTFVLRIEDTDKERNTDEALQVLLDGMRWLGLDWDEGPQAGGDRGPYFQSQRNDLYAEYIDKLKASGHLYEKEGALWFRLEGERYTEYDERKGCELEKVRGEPVVFEDAVRGRVERHEELDFVCVRSDGTPVFHLVNVIDDLTMGITHVIRGEDHLTNTAKHILLYRALGAELPVFAHLPLILKSTGKGKMSKRDTGALIEEYADRHFLPDAVMNYISLLGWNPKDESEVLSPAELIKRFDFDGVNSAGARFDEQKMAHFNTEHIRQKPVDEIGDLATPLLAATGIEPDSAYLQEVIRLCQSKLKSLEDLPAFTAFFFHDDFVIDAKAAKKILKKGDAVDKLGEVVEALGSVSDYSAEGLDQLFEETAARHERKKFDYFPLMRLAVSGQGGGPDLLGLLHVLGKDRVLSRFSKFGERVSAGEFAQS